MLQNVLVHQKGKQGPDSDLNNVIANMDNTTDVSWFWKWWSCIKTSDKTTHDSVELRPPHQYPSEMHFQMPACKMPETQLCPCLHPSQ